MPRKFGIGLFGVDEFSAGGYITFDATLTVSIGLEARLGLRRTFTGDISFATVLDDTVLRRERRLNGDVSFTVSLDDTVLRRERRFNGDLVVPFDLSGNLFRAAERAFVASLSIPFDLSARLGNQRTFAGGISFAVVLSGDEYIGPFWNPETYPDVVWGIETPENGPWVPETVSSGPWVPETA